MVPGDETANVLAGDGTHGTGESPAKGHTELVRASKLGLVPPATDCVWIVWTGAGCEEGLNKTLYGGRGDVESEGGEDKGGCDATAGGELMGEDVDETGELLEPEDDVSVDGEIAIGLGRILGRTSETEREKGAVGKLGYGRTVVLGRADCSLASFVVFPVFFCEMASRRTGIDPTKLVWLRRERLGLLRARKKGWHGERGTQTGTNTSHAVAMRRY